MANIDPLIICHNYNCRSVLGSDDFIDAATGWKCHNCGEILYDISLIDYYYSSQNDGV